MQADSLSVQLGKSPQMRQIRKLMKKVRSQSLPTSAPIAQANQTIIKSVRLSSRASNASLISLDEEAGGSQSPNVVLKPRWKPVAGKLKAGKVKALPDSEASSPAEVALALPPSALSSQKGPRSQRPRIFSNPVKYFTNVKDVTDKLVGVVITIFQGESYDPMFREVKPTTVRGERMSTYSISCSMVEFMHEYLLSFTAIRTLVARRKMPRPAVQLLHSFLGELEWRSLAADVHNVPADRVVFNWESCSSCGEHDFPCLNEDGDVIDMTLVDPAALRRSHYQLFAKLAKQIPETSPTHRQAMKTRFEKEPRAIAARGIAKRDTACSFSSGSATMQFMGFALRSGYTVMCSDSSLKSLLFEWSEEDLGPNPFMQIGTCDQEICLQFDPSELQRKAVPQQLQVVGKLCADSGKAVVNALPSTIVYTVNPDRLVTDIYYLKVLTVATEIDQSSVNLPPSEIERNKCRIGDHDTKKRGWAGHVALTYVTGGQLITSMAHWTEMGTPINMSLESVMQVVAKNFGGGEVAKFNAQLRRASKKSETAAIIQKIAHSMMTKSQPSRMKARTKC